MQNTDQVVEAIADALEQGLEGVVEGAKEDVRAWAVLMGSQATEAAAVGDQVTLDSLGRQSRMLAISTAFALRRPAGTPSPGSWAQS